MSSWIALNITVFSWNFLFFLFLATLWGMCDLSSPVSSVQFSRSVMSDSLQPHESQHARPPCPSPTPGVYSNSCPSSQWCHPAISSSVIPFSSCPQSLPASGSFPMSQFFAQWSGQSIGFSISPSNEHPGLISFRMDWLDLLAIQGSNPHSLQWKLGVSTTDCQGSPLSCNFLA